MNLNEQLQRQKSYLHHHGPISIQQRLKALMQLKQAIKQYETELEEALKKDLGKPSFEATPQRLVLFIPLLIIR